MNALVVYDSTYGNTQKVAEAVAKELKGVAVNATKFKKGDLAGVDLLVVGSPINGWRPTPKIQVLLDSLAGKLEGVKGASFDTRVKLFIHGDAAKKISKSLAACGAKIIANPKGFTVKGTEGPLAEGELEKAKEWAKSLKEGL